MGGVGNMALLEQPLTAFFASRRCSGRAIRAAMDWAEEQGRCKIPLIGGFHSPLEKSVLEVVLAADSPVVIVVARDVEHARFPLSWRRAMQSGTVAVIGMNDAGKRLTREKAALRNDWAAKRAVHIVVAFAQAEGNLAYQASRWQQAGYAVSFLAS